MQKLFPLLYIVSNNSLGFTHLRNYWFSLETLVSLEVFKIVLIWYLHGLVTESDLIWLQNDLKLYENQCGHKTQFWTDSSNLTSTWWTEWTPLGFTHRWTKKSFWANVFNCCSKIWFGFDLCDTYSFSNIYFYLQLKTRRKDIFLNYIENKILVYIGLKRTTPLKLKVLN